MYKSECKYCIAGLYNKQDGTSVRTDITKEPKSGGGASDRLLGVSPLTVVAIALLAGFIN